MRIILPLWLLVACAALSAQTLKVAILEVQGENSVTYYAGPAIVHSADFTLVTSDKPARAGEILTLYASGLGPTRPGVDSGEPFPTTGLQVVNSPVRWWSMGQRCRPCGQAAIPAL